MATTNNLKFKTKDINGFLLSIKHEYIDTNLIFTEVIQLSPKTANNLIISGVYESIAAAEQEINDSLLYLFHDDTAAKKCPNNARKSCCNLKGNCKNN